MLLPFFFYYIVSGKKGNKKPPLSGRKCNVVNCSSDDTERYPGGVTITCVQNTHWLSALADEMTLDYLFLAIETIFV